MLPNSKLSSSKPSLKPLKTNLSVPKRDQFSSQSAFIAHLRYLLNELTDKDCDKNIQLLKKCLKTIPLADVLDNSSPKNSLRLLRQKKTTSKETNILSNNIVPSLSPTLTPSEKKQMHFHPCERSDADLKQAMFQLAQRYHLTLNQYSNLLIEKTCDDLIEAYLVLLNRAKRNTLTKELLEDPSNSNLCQGNTFESMTNNENTSITNEKGENLRASGMSKFMSLCSLFEINHFNSTTFYENQQKVKNKSFMYLIAK